MAAQTTTKDAGLDEKAGDGQNHALAQKISHDNANNETGQVLRPGKRNNTTSTTGQSSRLADTESVISYYPPSIEEEEEEEENESSTQPQNNPQGNYRPPVNRRKSSFETDWSTTIDPDRPGQFALSHHRKGLLVSIDPWSKSLRARISRTFNFRWLDKLLYANNQDENPAPDQASDNGAQQNRYRISLAELQRMRIRKLQCLLVRDVVQMLEKKHEAQGWEEHLSQYVSALKEHDYMLECTKRWRDPFLVTGEFNLDNDIIEASLRRYFRHGDDDLEPQSSFMMWQAKESIDPPITGTRNRSQQRTGFQKFQARFLLAIVGGLFLVGPMWLMVLYTRKYTSLVTTTIMVILFALTLSIYLEESKDVLASTAAYAAVLVVFVGLTGPTNQQMPGAG